jgi:hypothetical protein
MSTIAQSMSGDQVPLILKWFTCARRFGNSDLSTAGHLGNGKAKVLEVRNFVPISMVSSCHLSWDKISVPVTDPQSFGPPGPGSGAFLQQVKYFEKPYTVFATTLYINNDVYVLKVRYKKKINRINIFFVGILKSH